MSRVFRVLSRPVVVGVVLVGLVGAGLGLYWFQPWKLWADETVREELPVAAANPSPVASSTPEPSATGAPSPTAPTGPETLATGRFISHEHATTGSVRILRLADGSLVLRLEDLDTSNGPDLRVWLTDAPVKPGQDGWQVFDDGAYVSAGKLKGNKGSQNYPLPSGTELDRFTSVSIWCDRFDVSFGAAPLTRA